MNADDEDYGDSLLFCLYYFEYLQLLKIVIKLIVFVVSNWYSVAIKKHLVMIWIWTTKEEWVFLSNYFFMKAK